MKIWNDEFNCYEEVEPASAWAVSLLYALAAGVLSIMGWMCWRIW